MLAESIQVALGIRGERGDVPIAQNAGAILGACKARVEAWFSCLMALDKD